MDICISGSEYVSCAHSGFNFMFVLLYSGFVSLLSYFYMPSYFLDTFCILMRKRKRFGWVGGKKRSLEELGGTIIRIFCMKKYFLKGKTKTKQNNNKNFKPNTCL